jgi:hypothetical protein
MGGDQSWRLAVVTVVSNGPNAVLLPVQHFHFAIDHIFRPVRVERALGSWIDFCMNAHNHADILPFFSPGDAT